eukprot:CAMPEP_0197020790 /NCGR_PEP_ID=MMETSP1384-20130603/1679_1 /TAXON_ID=29189 /ORGANISM="Ammonia sp." /LENGTH=103 /DNA_ID=CAMNT_0042448479 /DNA_START=69 /DNA_END=376 /DNA_ORIENTATION=+
MNVAARISRQALLRSRGVVWNRSSVRFGSSSSKGNQHEPLYPAGKFNMIQRKGKGFVNYIQEWEALIFSHRDYRWATTGMTIPSAFAVVIMVYVVWNSAWRDP